MTLPPGLRQSISVFKIDIFNITSFSIGTLTLTTFSNCPLDPNLIDGHHLLTGINALLDYRARIRSAFLLMPRGLGGDAHVAI